MSGRVLSRIRLLQGTTCHRNFQTLASFQNLQCETACNKHCRKTTTNLFHRIARFSQLNPRNVKFATTDALSSEWNTVSITGSGISNIVLKQDGILLTYGDFELDLLYIWLRDHCRSELCYNHSTNQKNVDNYSLSEDEIPANIEFDGTVLLIKWMDGHITSYNINWLLKNCYHCGHKDRIDKVSWDKSTLQSMELPTIQYKEYMTSDNGLRKHLLNLIKFGFSIVVQAPPNHEGTVEVSEKLSFTQRTHFGDTWTLKADNLRGDTAYTNVALGAHTDSTYFTTPSGIQVFHLLEHDGTGGETLLVDGLNCADRLKAKHPESFDLLTKVVIPHEYFEPEVKIRSLGTVLSVHPTTGDFMHLRFNPYDRSPLFTVPVDKQRAFYRAYGQLTKEIRCPDNEFWLKLRPGMVLFVDNWRVMHGRASFTGNRHVSGTYLPRDDYISRARFFGIVDL